MRFPARPFTRSQLAQQPNANNTLPFFRGAKLPLKHHSRRQIDCPRFRAPRRTYLNRKPAKRFGTWRIWKEANYGRRFGDRELASGHIREALPVQLEVGLRASVATTIETAPFIGRWYPRFSERPSSPLLLLTVATLMRPGHGVQSGLGNRVPAGYANAIRALLHPN